MDVMRPSDEPGPDRTATAPRVLLIGMMAAGKTTVGQALAAATGWPHLDNDELVQRATGRTTPEVLHGGDEATLRRVERAALDEALAATAPVVAGVAAGAILDPEARRRMAASAFVVYLQAPLALLRQRVGTGSDRPWLAEDPGAALKRLATGRDALYRDAADLVLEVEGATPDRLARQILDAIDREPPQRGADDRPGKGRAIGSRGSCKSPG